MSTGLRLCCALVLALCPLQAGALSPDEARRQLAALTPEVLLKEPLALPPYWVLVGYTLEPAPDESDRRYALERRHLPVPEGGLEYGRSYRLSLFFRSRANHAYNPPLSFVFEGERCVHRTAQIRLGKGKDASFQTGEMVRAEIDFSFFPEFTTGKWPPLDRTERLTVSLNAAAASGEPSRRIVFLRLDMAPLLDLASAWRFLTPNRDVPKKRSRSLLAATDFPDGSPRPHEHSDGRTPDELFDGAFTGRGSTHVEALHWFGANEAMRRRIRLRLERPARLEGLLLVVPRSSEDYFVREVTIRVGTGPEDLTAVGHWDNEAVRERLGTQLIMLNYLATRGSLVEVELAHQDGRPKLAVSELYLWGMP
jgi:hypothetical protein